VNVESTSNREEFERIVLPYLDDAYTLARYLVRDEHDAQDIVHEALLRAIRHFDGFRGGDPRAWILTIVRHCSYTWRRRRMSEAPSVEYDENAHGGASSGARATDARLLEESDRVMLERALHELPLELREVLVLREVEGMPYKEISRVVGVPIGTVMSRLARARERLRRVYQIIAKEANA
jgi:RNA polymerase sigma-70 factor, ECF subfamily